MSRIGVFFAEGYEEIEALTVVDVARRAQIEVCMISVEEMEEVKGSHGIAVRMDGKLSETDFAGLDMLVLPGGMPGTMNLKACTGLIELLKSFDREKKYIAAICAAPSILAELGMLKGRKACSYPSFEDKLDGADIVREPAVTDGHITTGRGMGTAIPFALRLTALLAGEAKAEEIKESIVYGI